MILALVCVLGFVFAGTLLFADTTPPPAPDSGTFGKYLADHQDDLAGFFNQNDKVLARDALPLLFVMTVKIGLIVLVVGWFLDVALGRLFSTLFAPAYAKWSRAFIYASGRGMLGVILTVFLSLVLTFCLSLSGAGLATLMVVMLLALPAFFIQVMWVSYLYRSSLSAGFVFYIALLAVHSILAAIITPLFFSTEANAAITRYVDQSLAPLLHDSSRDVRRDARASIAARDAVQAKITALQARITQAQNDQQEAKKAIEDRKNSADFAYSRLVKMRARGDLAGARAQFVDFLKRFPSGPRSDAARAQMGEIDRSLAAQAAMEKEEKAMEARATAKARAELLARASLGQVTLSEMRAALLGKTPAQVSALFGPPTETASNRWGYGKRMILNATTSTHLGLTVVFADGLVQGVDYYYGSDQ